MELQKKRRLVQLSSSLSATIGGPHSVIINTHDHLEELYDYRLIVFGKGDENIKGIKINSTLGNSNNGLRLLPPDAVSKNLIGNADLILIHGFYTFTTLFALYYSKTNNLFMMPHGSLGDYFQKKSKLRKRIFSLIVHKLLRNRSLHFLVGSNSEIESIKIKFPDSKISVVGLGVPKHKSIPLKNLKLHEPYVLVCMSRIALVKRIDLCIRVLSALNSEGKKFKLRIYGSGDKKLERDLKSLAATLKVDDSVEFLGFVSGEAKWNALRQSHILLLPSESENFAIALAEAISVGKPVVTSRFVAMHEFVDRNNTGITMQELTVDELCSSILKVVNNYHRFAAACFNSAPQLYWDEVIKNWKDAIEHEDLDNE